jgi:5-methylcytosine-specific restriction endonuclease McrA
MERSLEQEVWRRAKVLCEYCRMPQVVYRVPFQIDHIIARQHGGLTVSENLALSCFHCNTPS